MGEPFLINLEIRILLFPDRLDMVQCFGESWYTSTSQGDVSTSYAFL